MTLEDVLKDYGFHEYSNEAEALKDVFEYFEKRDQRVIQLLEMLPFDEFELREAIDILKGNKPVDRGIYIVGCRMPISSEMILQSIPHYITPVPSIDAIKEIMHEQFRIEEELFNNCKEAPPAGRSATHHKAVLALNKKDKRG